MGWRSLLSSSWQGSYYLCRVPVPVHSAVVASFSNFLLLLLGNKTYFLASSNAKHTKVYRKRDIYYPGMYLFALPPTHKHNGSPFNFNLLLIITSALLPFTSISTFASHLAPSHTHIKTSHNVGNNLFIIRPLLKILSIKYVSCGWDGILHWVSQNEWTNGFTLTADDCTLCLHSIIFYFIPFTAKKSFCKAKSFPSPAFGCGPSSFTFHPSHPFSYVLHWCWYWSCVLFFFFFCLSFLLKMMMTIMILCTLTTTCTKELCNFHTFTSSSSCSTVVAVLLVS